MKEREKDKASELDLVLKIVSFFCDLAGTEQDHIIKLHDTIVQPTTQVK